MPAKRGVSYADLVKFAATLPDVEESTSYGTPALKVRGKLMARLWEDGETVVLKSEWEGRERLMATWPDIFFLTDHYLKHPYVLMRLAAAKRDVMQDAVTAAWKTVVPKTPAIKQQARRRVRSFVDKSLIRDLVNRFANTFDLKDWQGMQACLCSKIDTDYSDLRGTPPETTTSKRFVELRKKALESLATQHLMSNHDVETDGDMAHATVSCVIFRKSAEGGTLNTHCLYFFGFKRETEGWKISAIRQKVLISDGDTGIHAGIAKK
jgi:ketosteroid isomerase-like protein